MLKIPDDSVDMDTNEKKNSTMSRTNDPYSDTIEQTLIKLESQKDRPSFDKNFDESYRSDNIALSVPPVNAG